MRNELIRIDLKERGVVAFAAETTDAGLEAEWRHLAGRIAAEALARAITATVLAAGFLRDDERLSLQVKSEGKLRGLLVDVGAEGDVRGYTDVKVLSVMDPGPSDLAYAIGSRGKLRVIKSTTKDVSSSGSVELRRGDIASDLEHYLETSEQRRSIVELSTTYGEHLDYSGGLLVQAGPGYDAEFFDGLGARRAELGQVLAKERDPEHVLAAIFQGERYEIAARRRIKFKCQCSRERVLRMIAGLDRAELEDILAKEKETVVTCHFCNDEYEVDEQTLRGMLDDKGGGAAGG